MTSKEYRDRVDKLRTADPHCIKCNGSGYYTSLFNMQEYTCDCLGYENINANIPMTREEFNDFIKPRKPKRKRHILKRKKRA